MNYAEIKYCDIANGQGVRTTLFVSGCRRGCPGCFNSGAFSFAAGEPFDEKKQQEVLESLKPIYVKGITILGGEPFEPENQGPLADFLERVKAEFPKKTIWCFTGFVYEPLAGLESLAADDVEARGRTADTDRLLGLIDVLVDGPYVEDLHDITLRFRGSSNQRLIDMNETRRTGQVVLWHDDPQYATRGQML